jgi:hypothetical protein
MALVVLSNRSQRYLVPILATSFLFAIHFFHVHLRPDKFPVDHVIFTGSMTEQEMAAERPIELEQLMAEGKLEAFYAQTPNSTQLAVDRVVGLALLVGMFWTEILARFL